MLSKIHTFIYISGILCFTYLFSGSSVFAQPDNGGGSKDDAGGGIKTAVRLENPLGETDTIWELVTIVINIVQTIMIPLVVLFLIYSGFLFVTAQGNESKLTKAKQVFFYTIIGTAIIIGAEALSLLIQGTIDQLKTGA